MPTRVTRVSRVGQMKVDPALSNRDLLPVGQRRRTWNWWNIAALWIGMSICIPTYTLASSLVDRGWTWQAAVGAIVLGNLVVLIPIALNSHAGTRYGIPFPVLCRAAFGVLGANVPAVLRALVACGWFGIQTWIGGWALYKLIEVLWPNIATLPAFLPEFVGLNSGEFLCFMAFWAVNVAVVLRGMESIRFLESWGSPFLLAVGVALFVWAWRKAGGLGPMLENPTPSPDGGAGFAGVLGPGLTSAVAFWGTMALSIPDFSRYAKSQRDQVVGQALGLPGSMALFAFIGAAVTNATVVIFGARVADPVALLAQIGGPAMIALAMAGLTIATLTTNIAANVVAPANGFSNLAPRLISFKAGAMITAVIGIAMFPWRLYNDAAAYIFTWLIGYGALLGPVAGIMIADYFVLRRGVLAVPDLYKRGGVYDYQRGVNWIAMGALVIGVAPSIPGFIAALRGTTAPTFFATAYDWAWFIGFFAAATVHVVGMKWQAAKGTVTPDSDNTPGDG
jgi:NCS1 family nucleobase:cation symporter-1